MARRGKYVSLFLLAMATVTGGLAYLQTRSSWRMATDAELRAAVDPSLLYSVPEDPAAQERFTRFVKIAESIKGRLGAPGQEAALMAAFLREDGAKLPRIEAILDEGPLERPAPRPGAREKLTTQPKTLMLMLQQAAWVEANAGRAESSARLFRLALRLTFAFEGHALHEIDLASRDFYLAGILRRLYPVLGKLGERELASIATAIPITPNGENDYPRILRVFFQREIRPVLSNPREGEKIYRDRMGSRSAPDAPVGSFDAVETARFMSAVLMEGMANAQRRRPYYVDAAEKRIVFLHVTLPTDRSIGAQGPMAAVRKFQYRMGMARIPNSFAREYLFPLVVGNHDLMESSFRGRTAQEALRTLIALRRYRIRHRAPAPALEALVQEDLLPALPLDFLGADTLRYDTARRRLWSVGMNGTDDGGTYTGLNDPFSHDYLWITP